MNVDFIMAYEMGEADDLQVLENFAEGIKSGMVWSLQGAYGRQAAALIENGFITEDGEITSYAWDVLDGADPEFDA